MDKRLTAKRLLKRHNRHESSALNWAKLSKPDLRTPERIRAEREASRRATNVPGKAKV